MKGFNHRSSQQRKIDSGLRNSGMGSISFRSASEFLPSFVSRHAYDKLKDVQQVYHGEQLIFPEESDDYKIEVTHSGGYLAIRHLTYIKIQLRQAIIFVPHHEVCLKKEGFLVFLITRKQVSFPQKHILRIVFSNQPHPFQLNLMRNVIMKRVGQFDLKGAKQPAKNQLIYPDQRPLPIHQKTQYSQLSQVEFQIFEAKRTIILARKQIQRFEELQLRAEIKAISLWINQKYVQLQIYEKLKQITIQSIQIVKLKEPNNINSKVLEILKKQQDDYSSNCSQKMDQMDLLTALLASKKNQLNYYQCEPFDALSQSNLLRLEQKQNKELRKLLLIQQNESRILCNRHKKQAEELLRIHEAQIQNWKSRHNE